MYYDMMNAILQMIRVCMGGDSCDYNLFVSLGAPPAICNSIAAYIEQAQRSEVDSDDCNTVTEDEIVILLTRCCGETEEFDPAAEDAEAKCFLRDLFTLKTCIECNLRDTLDPYTHCAPQLDGIAFDSEREGGCYSAAIRISLSEISCCPPPEPPAIP